MSISRPRHFNEIKSEGGITPEQQATIDDNTDKITSNWTINGDDISSSNSGNVGIGTTSPIFHLDIRKSDPTVCIGALTEYEEAKLYFMTPHEPLTGSLQKAKCLLLAEGIGSHSRSDFHICLQSVPDNNITASKNDSKLTIKGVTGYVGINTTDPAANLHVMYTGDRNVNSDKYHDNLTIPSTPPAAQNKGRFYIIGSPQTSGNNLQDLGGFASDNNSLAVTNRKETIISIYI